MVLPNRYSSKASLYINPISNDVDPHWEDFSDIQMAYLRMKAIMDSHTGDWNIILPFKDVANFLDQRILELGVQGTCVCVFCADLEVYMYYEESLTILNRHDINDS